MFDRATRHQDVEFLCWKIVPEVVALVLTCPEFAGFGVERESGRVPQPLADGLSKRSVCLVADDGSAPGVSFLADVAARTDRDVEPIVGTELNLPSPVASGREVWDDHGFFSKPGSGQANDLVGFADVEVSFVERQPVRLIESGYDDIWIPVSCSICIQIKTYNLSG